MMKTFSHKTVEFRFEFHRQELVIIFRIRLFFKVIFCNEFESRIACSKTHLEDHCFPVFVSPRVNCENVWVVFWERKITKTFFAGKTKRQRKKNNCLTDACLIVRISAIITSFFLSPNISNIHFVVKFSVFTGWKRIV